MKKKLFFTLLFICSFGLSYYFIYKSSHSVVYRNLKDFTFKSESEDEESETGFAKEAAEWLYGQRAYPLGYVPADWRDKAFTHINKYNSSKALKKISQNLTWTGLGPNNIGGRVRAIVVDPNDANIVYAGSVSGGVWKTTDGGNNWFPLDDHMANLAVCSLVLDPNNSNILYAGTGEGFSNYDYIRGAGIFKTTDAGLTWTQLSSTNNSDFYFVNRLVIDHTTSNIYAATRTGLFKSTDGGTTFTKMVDAASLGNGSCLDVIINYTTPTTIFATFGLFVQSQIWRSTDGGNTFSFNYSKSGMGRIEMAGSASNPQVAYASFVDPNSYQVGFMAVTVNAGKSWNSISIPGPATDGSSTYTGKQGWYNNALVVDPDNASKAFAAGIDMFTTTDMGNKWYRVTNAYYPNDPHPSVHADIHTIVFAPSNHQIMYTGTDGGIYYSKDRGSYWYEDNNNLSITQFYYGAVAPTGNIYYGGTQDNYTLKSSGSKVWGPILGGDGGVVEVNYNSPLFIYAEQPNFTFFKSTNGGSTFAYAQNGLPINSSTHETTDRTLFITPFTMDPNNPSILIAGTYRLWRTTDGAASWTAISGDLTGDGTGSTGSKISAVTIAQENSSVIYAGCSNGKLQITTDGGTAWTERDAGLPIAYITRIATVPNDPSTAYVSYSGFVSNNKVYKSTNYGQTWTNVSGDLPNIPVNCLVVNPYVNDNLFAGTDLGVFSTTNGGTNWTQDNDGLANVSVFDLDYRASDNTMYAATHGRGMFVTTLPIGTEPLTLSYDKGTPAGGYAWTVAGMESANRITSPVKNAKLISMSIYFTGIQNGNAEYTPIVLNADSGAPGNDYALLSPKTASNIPGWDVTDLSSYNISVSGDFFVGLKYDGTNQPMFGYSKSSNGRAWNNAGGGWAAWSQTYFMRAVIQSVTTSVVVNTKVPETFKLFQNYPNPFNPSTTIRYELPSPAKVKIIVYDLNGEKIASLVDNYQAAGEYNVTWNGKNDFGQDVASGIYFYSVQAGSFNQVNKMIKLK